MLPPLPEALVQPARPCGWIVSSSMAVVLPHEGMLQVGLCHSGSFLLFYSIPRSKAPGLLSLEGGGLLPAFYFTLRSDLRPPCSIGPRSFLAGASHAKPSPRRCNVRSLRLAGIHIRNDCGQAIVNSFANATGSAMSQPSITGHASANGTRVFHQCLALGCLRCVGRASPSFHPKTGS